MSSLSAYRDPGTLKGWIICCARRTTQSFEESQAGYRNGMNTFPTLRDIYPDLTEDELAIAEDNLDRYIEITLAIYERVRSSAAQYVEFQTLTRSLRPPYAGDVKVECNESKPLSLS